jgi:BirA family biotin operon repressor/biotin-[acetyl-CoA-carboxylase] ligase
MELQVIGSYVIRLSRIDSTNRYAMDYLDKHHLPDGSLIIAQEQFRGKGTGLNQWESEPGKNLTFSVVLHTNFLPPERQFMLNKVFSLALHDFISTLLGRSSASIKWPNDLYIGTKKAAGMLVQNIIQGSTLITSVVGIGININQDVFVSDAPNPVSLKNVSGEEYDVDRCLIDLCSYMDHRYNQLRKSVFDLIDRDYITNLFRIGEYCFYSLKGRETEARICGVDRFGRLVLETREGRTIVADQKEIGFLVG